MESIKPRLFFLLPMMLVASLAFAQEGAAPDAIACYNWDQSYVTFFHFMLGAAFLGTLVLGLLLPPFLGKRFWLLTRPYLRVVVFSGVMFVLTLAAVLAWPHVAVDPQYFLCADVAFGPEGLLGGRIGEGVAAISQRLTMAGFLVLSALAGAILGIALSVAANRYAVGIPRQAIKV